MRLDTAEPKHGEAKQFAALHDIRVLDLSRVLAGPYCTMMLGDLGADVIKVESPLGDDTRRWGPPYFGSESAYYLCCNRNKRGVVLDLNTEAGREIALKLALKSDIIVENFRLGAMEKWGLGYETLSAQKPDLIYCGISGYGRTGPLAHMPGYDYVIQGVGGIMSVTGERNGPPTKIGVAIVDLTAGMFALSAILAALRVRDLTGIGQRIDMSLFDAQLAWLANVGSNYLISGEVPLRHGNAHPNIVPYQAFKTGDGWIVVAVGNDTQWKRFCTAIAMSELRDDARFTTNAGRVTWRDTLCPIIQEVMYTRSSDEWLRVLEAADIPAGPVNSVDQTFKMPQVEARGMLQEIDHPTLGPLKMVASPLKLENTPPAISRHPPLLGEHTDSVLQEVLGIDGETLAILRGSGAIA